MHGGALVVWPGMPTPEPSWFNKAAAITGFCVPEWRPGPGVLSGGFWTVVVQQNLHMQTPTRLFTIKAAAIDRFLAGACGVPASLKSSSAPRVGVGGEGKGYGQRQ